MPFKKLLTKKSSKKSGGYRGNPHYYSNRLSYEDLINTESQLGKTIFGPIPDGCEREFFEYRKNVWIWHEKSLNPQGVMQEMTVRYEVRPEGVFKKPGNQPYSKIYGDELENFRQAVKQYYNLIKTKLYC